MSFHCHFLRATCAVILFYLTPAALAADNAGAGSGTSEAGRNQVEQHWGFLDQYCVTCHNLEDWSGQVAFDLTQPGNVPNERALWETAVRKLRGNLMPPPGAERPEREERKAFVSALESYLDESAEQHVDPGYVTLHRLNRSEYENEVERVLGVEVDAAELLPEDTRSEGFSNIAEVLQVSPTFFEAYIAAGRKVSIKAVGEPWPKVSAQTYSAIQGVDHTAHVEGLPLGTRGGMVVDHYFPADGEYRFNIDIASADGYYLRSHWLEYENTLILTIDGERMFEAKVGGKEDLRAVDRDQSPAVSKILARFLDIAVPVNAGTHRIGVTWRAKTYAESDVELQLQHPGMGVESIPQIKGFAFAGPYSPTGISSMASREKIFSCYPQEASKEAACARHILADLASQAYRRPVDEDDLAPLLAFYRAGREKKGFESGIQNAIMAMLSSPKFLFRIESPPEHSAPGEVFHLSDVALASRLSFFLWAQGPDQELRDLAAQGRLREPDVLKGQVARMLGDSRASSLASSFALQWLKIDVMDSINPDARRFPNFDPALKLAFTQELTLFIDSILRSDRSIIDLLTASHTFVNERLARHYGINSIRGSGFRRVELPNNSRRGLLGKGAVLLATSYPDRTSPVLRGAWIMENILGAAPAAPPPEVDAFPEIAAGEEVSTVRERLEHHRAIPSCNSCHGVIDPLGLALENFNAVGKWRDKDRYAGVPIDASGQLVDGTPIEGPADLRVALVRESEQFVQTFTEKLLSYALGRLVEHEDMPVVRGIVREAAEQDYTFASIVNAVVLSEPFRMKKMPSAESVPDLQEFSQLQ